MLIDAKDKATAIVAKMHSHTPIRAYLKTHEAAEYLNLGASTLERKRIDGSGPAFRVLGRRAVRYAVSDLDEWASRCALTATKAA